VDYAKNGNPVDEKSPLKDPISDFLAPVVQHVLNSDADTDGSGPDSESEGGHARLHEHYVREMRYICVTHTLGWISMRVEDRGEQ
jgi:hypothetical protein